MKLLANKEITEMEHQAIYAVMLEASLFELQETRALCIGYGEDTSGKLIISLKRTLYRDSLEAQMSSYRMII